MDNDKIKKELEIENLQLDLRQKKTDFWLNILKYILGVVGAIIVFQFITRKDSSEAISRERAKMLIEVMKEDNPELREQGIEIIKATYPSDDPWIKDIDNLLRKQALNEQSNELLLMQNEWLAKKTDYEERKNHLNPNSVEFEINEVKLGLVDEKLNQISVKLKSIDKSVPKNK